VTISVVIPTLDEAAGIVRSVESVVAPGIEVIVVDGGSQDETCRLARDAGVRVLASRPGRARQLRMGGEKSTGDVVLFLHADTRLECGWSQAVRQAMADPECAGGAFAFRFTERGALLRWIELGVALRVALFRLPYGDQAIFVRRSVLEHMGGIPIVPIMEDLDLVRAIKRAGRLQMLERTATTSSRRYVRGGSLRTMLQHQRALLGWWLGWDRTRLAERMGR
jgi:rSAM/selenodomain-associated transferase 2